MTTIKEAIAFWQRKAKRWIVTTFSQPNFDSRPERHRRFLEEAGELCQAGGMSEEEAIASIRFVYSRPAGHVPQEIGGTMHTFLALVENHGLNAWECFLEEIGRVHQPEVVEKCRAKWLEKQKIGQSIS
ncbi:hypothetical protein [Mesorhizobium sp. CN2-181]|uniref:hypothetical protein n=1 Tax=Mesorhizobium yinganensis TaxID=3157707 RepID=UPI0032B7CAFE